VQHARKQAEKAIFALQMMQKNALLGRNVTGFLLHFQRNLLIF
jgi:hypothetical protein